MSEREKEEKGIHVLDTKRGRRLWVIDKREESRTRGHLSIGPRTIFKSSYFALS